MSHESQIIDLLRKALQLSQDEQRAFLKENCPQPDMRRELESLLQWGRDLSRFKDKLPQPGDQVGHYRICEQLGEGGTGVVYRAERDISGTTWDAAIKFLRPQFLSRTILGRYERTRIRGETRRSKKKGNQNALHDELTLATQDLLAERFPDPRFMARLNHPNIATLHDVGTTEQGLPYVVMEYVDGQPIDEYCRSRGLGFEARLLLFLSVCQAVSHAHRHMTIHCDLKPSNILVTPEGQVKLLDFSVAQVLGPDLLSEQAAHLGMTPAYASPEQVRGEALSVSTDVYSLGVVLYELLSGQRPYDLGTRAPHECQKVICNRTPLLASESASHATHAMRVPNASRDLKGDLDAILQKALCKDPEDRYQSIEAFSKDARRYIDRLPVSARSSNAFYPAWKFARRHWLGVGIGCTVFLMLSIFVWVLALQQTEIVRQRDFALRHLDRAQYTTDLLIEAFDATDPYRDTADGTPVTADQILQAGAARVSEQLGNQPLVRADLITTIGRAYRRLADFPKAQKYLTEGFDIRKNLLKEDDLVVADSLYNLGMLCRDLGQYSDAKNYFKRALQIQELQLEHKVLQNVLKLSSTLFDLGVTLRFTRELDQAEPVLGRALEIRRKHLGSDDMRVAAALSELGILHRLRDELDLAEELFEQALEIQKKVLPARHTNIANSYNNLAILNSQRSNYGLAEKYYKDALEILEAILGERHPHALSVLSSLAVLYLRTGDLAQAERLYLRLQSIREATLGRDHPDVALSLQYLATVFRLKGEYSKAVPLFNRALRIQNQQWGQEHPSIARTLNNFALVFFDQGDYKRAGQFFGRSLQVWLSVSPNNSEAAMARKNLATIHRLIGEFATAESLLLEALEIQREIYGDDHPETAQSLHLHGSLLQDRGADDQAEPLLRTAIEVYSKSIGEEHARTAMALHDLAKSQDRGGHSAEAEALYRRGLETLEKLLGGTHSSTLQCKLNLAWHYIYRSDFDLARPLMRQLLSASEEALLKNREHQRILLFRASALVGIGFIEKEESSLGEAMGLLQEAVTALTSIVQEQGTVQALDLLAKAYFLLGRFAEAHKILDRLEQVGWHDQFLALLSGSEDMARLGAENQP